MARPEAPLSLSLSDCVLHTDHRALALAVKNPTHQTLTGFVEPMEERLAAHDAAGGRGWMQGTRDTEGTYQCWLTHDVERPQLEGYPARIRCGLFPVFFALQQCWNSSSNTLTTVSPCLFAHPSVLPGETLPLHLSCEPKQSVALSVVREGDRSSKALLETTFAGVGPQPVRPGAWCRGANWPIGGHLTIPRTWQSGVYRLELCAAETGARCQLLVVVRASVRPSTPGQTSAAPLLMLSTYTYFAYNNWGGHSMYGFSSRSELAPADEAFRSYVRPQGGRGGLQSVAVSPHRPGHGYGGTGEGRFCTFERHFVEWCEAMGVDLEFCTNEDVDAAGGADLLGRYRLVLSVGHDEYWTSRLRDTLEGFADRGGNLAFFGGNNCCWQVTRSETDGAMHCHKQFWREQPQDILTDPKRVTGLMALPCVFGAGRPPNALLGLGTAYGGYHRCHGQLMDGSGAFTVCQPDAWPLRGTGLALGDTFGGAHSIVGYECDGLDVQWVVRADGVRVPVATGVDGTPDDFEVCAWSPCAWGDEFSAFPELASEAGLQRTGTVAVGHFRRAGGRGGVVFNAGATDWVYGLAGRDGIVERITLNVLEELSGQQPPSRSGPSSE
jgi:hypothetical protein